MMKQQNLDSLIYLTHFGFVSFVTQDQKGSFKLFSFGREKQNCSRINFWHLKIDAFVPW